MFVNPVFESVKSLRDAIVIYTLLEDKFLQKILHQYFFPVHIVIFLLFYIVERRMKRKPRSLHIFSHNWSWWRNFSFFALKEGNSYRVLHRILKFYKPYLRSNCTKENYFLCFYCVCQWFLNHHENSYVIFHFGCKRLRLYTVYPV